MAAEWWPSGGKVSAGCRPTCLSVHVDRHIGQVLVDISAECRSPYRPIVSTNTRSTDALSTHDPSKLYFYKRHVPDCQGDTHDNLHQKIPDPGITVKLTIT